MIDYTPCNDKDYHQIFIHEAKELIEIFRNEIVELHHFGNNAVKDIPGNMTIDILPIVKSLSQVSLFVDKMEALGYKEMDAQLFTDDECRLFVAKKHQLTYYVTMIERSNHEAISRKLALRDYLRAHKAERLAYAKYKMKQAVQNRNDYKMYKHFTSDYILNLEKKALQWYRSQSR
ncbi:GrpB family protein [Macrococcus capreoli]|uniref:GrpB family protein n=1 Tax=Macrococcus capreoli TaxID=2982690 RepID=UPI003EE77E42